MKLDRCFFIIASNNSLNNNSDEIGYIYMVHKCQIIDYITTKKKDLIFWISRLM